jgi:two-component system response regulator DesR
MSATVIRVLLADDEVLVRGALAALLGLEPDLRVVAEAASGSEAITLAARERPDIAVVDLEMPPGDGLIAAAEIRARCGIPVLLVTRHARPAVLRRALAAGIRGFVPKTAPASRLAEIVRDVHAGHRYVDPDIAASALAEPPCPLTERELDVLLEARNGGGVKEIATAVHLAPGTVRNYLSAAMAKLAAPHRQAAVRTAWEQGWI